MVRLFSSVYCEHRPERQAEYLRALLTNLACPAIDGVFVLAEGGEKSLPSSAKLYARPVRQRPTYEDFFAWANELAQPDDISIIANSDISFDATIAAAANALRSRECYALARWEEGGLLERNDSQDSWIFRGKITGVHAKFPLGVPRCDNRLLFELQTAGYHVFNPALTIISRHHHAGQRGEYSDTNQSDFVEPPYRYIWPHNLWGLPSTILHNLAHRDARVAWRFDRRKAATSLPMRVLRKVRSTAARGSSSTVGHD
jgi:hypothetical protein